MKQSPALALEGIWFNPFGLAMTGISDRAVKSQCFENKFRFNGGNELQNKEFSDGTGLELYDATYRNYDAQIGRFNQIDPLEEMAEDWSTYSFAMDNPILLNDPLGLAPDDIVPDYPDHKPPPPKPIPIPHPPAPIIEPGPMPNTPPNPNPVNIPSDVTPWMPSILNDAKILGGQTEDDNPTWNLAQKALNFTMGGVNADPTETPWCASYGCYKLRNSGASAPRSAASRDWNGPLVFSKLNEVCSPYYGSIVVFRDYSDAKLKTPKTTGHIGFLYGLTPNGKYIILGGNQGNTLRFSIFSNLQYIKGIGYMHIEGFFMPKNYTGPLLIAPIHSSVSTNFINVMNGVFIRKDSQSTN
ncbi:MAG: hypothetical protein JST58_20625 [Bacteroidetes bacterium]|nr:hypothetical protein [Bacteroidota bacterium]